MDKWLKRHGNKSPLISHFVTELHQSWSKIIGMDQYPTTIWLGYMTHQSSTGKYFTGLERTKDFPGTFIPTSFNIHEAVINSSKLRRILLYHLCFNSIYWKFLILTLSGTKTRQKRTMIISHKACVKRNFHYLSIAPSQKRPHLHESVCWTAIGH